MDMLYARPRRLTPGQKGVNSTKGRENKTEHVDSEPVPLTQDLRMHVPSTK